MIHGRSGCRAERPPIRVPRVLVSAIWAVMGLELGAIETASADLMRPVFTFETGKRCDSYLARYAAGDAQRLRSVPGAKAIVPGPPGTIRDSLDSIEASLERLAFLSAAAEALKRKLPNQEVDSTLLASWCTAELMSLSAPAKTLETLDGIVGTESTAPVAASAAESAPPARVATDPATGAAMPTPLRIVATALESVAIMACGLWRFPR